MAITVKLPRKNNYLLPHMCVACGAGSISAPIFRYESQCLSHTNFTFYVCNKCAQYTEMKSKDLKFIPAEDRKRTLIARWCVGVKLPFFYLGKVEFSFLNDGYGIMFWKLNGGEMSEKHTELPEFK